MPEQKGYLVKSQLGFACVEVMLAKLSFAEYFSFFPQKDVNTVLTGDSKVLCWDL